MTRLRSALFCIWFYTVTTCLCLASPLALLRARRRGRAAATAYARLWARLILKGLTAICGTSWRLEGLEHLPPPGRAILIAAQHQSTFETVLWSVLRPDVAFVVKRELFAVPLFGGMLRATGMIAVDRAAGASALRRLVRDAAAAAAEGRTIIIFPEGTRSPPDEVGVLRPGVALLAERLGVPVFPVTTDSGRFWSRRGCRKAAGMIRVTVLPALPAGLRRVALLNSLAEAFRSGP